MSPTGYPWASIVLGWVPCKACKVRVWWTGLRWVEASGRKHECEVRAGDAVRDVREPVGVAS